MSSLLNAGNPTSGALLNGFAPYLSKEFVDTEFGFYGQTLRGVKENQPRWKRAVNTINGNLGEMLGKLYVERHFTPQAKARMEQLVENLRAAFREGIDRPGVDEPGDQGRGAGEAREVHARRSATPTSGATIRACR